MEIRTVAVEHDWPSIYPGVSDNKAHADAELLAGWPSGRVL